ncbi:nuclear transport factor 2 family protein [Flavobacteriaceae bacterium KMM 6898]|nr:nuclear transport factor 2 family protein [Flavobacteriaceae bacterium KMM 6898]
MKKIILLTLLLVVAIGHSQKKKNGTIYLEHPAIDVVNAMHEAFVAGDQEKVGTYLAEDFMAYNGTDTNKDAKGRNKESFLNQVKFWNENFDYLSISASAGAYPDALEYKDDQIWVQTWNQLNGVHNKTGVKLDMPFQRMFKLNKDNKITHIINYFNTRVYWEIGESFEDRKNGTIYNHHDNINSVRRMMSAFENNDLDKAYGYFTEDARFNSLELPDGETLSLEETKERNKGIMDAFEINSIDVVGYPDYLEYDLRDGKAVQSWWKFRLTRKSDGKKIILPALYIHDFDDEGKIISSNSYISTKVLDAK